MSSKFFFLKTFLNLRIIKQSMIKHVYGLSRTVPVIFVRFL